MNYQFLKLYFLITLHTGKNILLYQYCFHIQFTIFRHNNQFQNQNKPKSYHFRRKIGVV